MGPLLLQHLNELKVVFPSKSVQWSGFTRKIAATDRELRSQSLSEVERFEGYACSLRNAREWFDSF